MKSKIVITLLLFCLFNTDNTSAAPLEISHEFFSDNHGVGGHNGGNGISLDTDQVHMIMGSRGTSSGSGGSATIFKFENNEWVEQQTLRPPFDYNQYYAHSVAIKGNIAVVGAPKGHGSGYESGVAYVYELNNDTWLLTQIIQSDDGADSELFGYSIVIANDEVVIGSPKNDAEDSNVGAVDIFSKTDDQWIITQKLDYTPPSGTKLYSNFGYSLDFNGQHIIVSAPFYNLEEGIVYSFEKTNNNWQQAQFFQANDKETSAYFGYKVAIDQNNLIVSALLLDQQGPGKIYLYQSSNNLWAEQSSFTPVNPAFEEGLGTSIDIYNDIVVAGADLNEDLGDEKGSIYLFELNGNQLNFTQKLYNPDYETSSFFGRSSLVFGNQVIASNGYGETYSFTNNGTSWEVGQFVSPVLGSTDERFGYLTEINEQHAIIFASNRIDNEPHYLYFFHKNESDEWELLLKQTFNDVEFKKGLALSISDNKVVFYGYDQLYVFEFSNNNWQLTSQHDLPFAKIVFENNQVIEQATIHTITHQNNYIATITYDSINDTILTHILKLDDGNISINLLDEFTPEIAGTKDIEFINDTLITPFTLNNPSPTDVVKVYRLSNDQWESAGFIESPIIREKQNFGSTIAYDKQLLAIGATNQLQGQFGQLEYSGNVHLYRFNDNGWSFQNTLNPTSNPKQAFFGTDIHLDGETILVKSFNEAGGGFYPMNIHKYSKLNHWVLNDVYESNYASTYSYDNFAHDISGIDNTLLVGIPNANYSGRYSGRATLYKTSENYQISGTVTNLLPGNTIQITLNERDILEVNQSSFTFDMTLPANHQYNVTVNGTAKPLTQECIVTNSQGTVPNEDVTNINVTCLDFVDLIFESGFD